MKHTHPFPSTPSIFLAVTCVLWVALASTTAGAKTLRYASQDDPQTLDPHSANLQPTTRVLAQVYEGLVGRDKNFKLVPALAVSWSQPDPKTWRFKLRPNVKFHEGQTLSADDVVFSPNNVPYFFRFKLN